MVTAESSSERAARDARRMFRAVIAGWAQDLLGLRARGLARPGKRRARRLLAKPGAARAA